MRTLRSIRHRPALLLALPTGALVLIAALGTATEQPGSTRPTAPTSGWPCWSPPRNWSDSSSANAA